MKKTSHKIDTWEHEFYFVACPRSDGTAPSVEKACGEKIFFDMEEAIKYRDGISEKVGFSGFDVFKAIAVVPREKPVKEK